MTGPLLQSFVALKWMFVEGIKIHKGDLTPVCIINSSCDYIGMTEKMSRHRMTHKMSGSMRIAVLAAVISLSNGYTSPWGYTCEGGTTCKKQKKDEVPDLLSWSACSLICPSGNSLWPLPRSFSTGNSVTAVHPDLSQLFIQVNDFIIQFTQHC